MKSKHRSRKVLGITKIVQNKILFVTIVSIAIAGPGVVSGQWGSNMEVFGRFSDNRIVGGFEFVAPVWQDNKNLTFAELKAHVSDRGSQEFNIGLGHRRLNKDGSWIFGGFTQYDRRSTRHHKNYDHLTLGLEALGTLFDARLSYYHPLTDEQRITGWVGGLQYSGHRTFTQESYEEALKGWDGEVGALLPVSDTVETRLYAGAYTLNGDLNNRNTGWKTRLEIRPLQSLSLELSYRDDDLFGSEAAFTLRYAFGYPNQARVRTLRERMIQPTRRDLDTLVTPPDVTPLQSVVLQNNTIHIDSLRGAPIGDGTYERPYQSVDACLAGRCSKPQGSAGGEGALVRFWKGNGKETSSYVAKGSWDLLNGQTIWGEGWVMPEIQPTSNPVYDLSAVLSQGRLDANLTPWFSPGGEGKPGITLANNNEVMGVGVEVKGDTPLFGSRATMDLVSGFYSELRPGAYGFFGQNVTGFNIHHNIVRSESSGIVISTTEGRSTGRVAENVVASKPIEPTLGIDSDGGQHTGIALVNIARRGASVLQDIDVTGNQVTIEVPKQIYDSYYPYRYLFDGILIANATDSGKATQTLSFADNQVSAIREIGDGRGNFNFQGTGLRVVNMARSYTLSAPAAATQTVSLSGDTFTGNADNAAEVGNRVMDMAASGTQTLAVANVSFQGLQPPDGESDEALWKTWFYGLDIRQHAHFGANANQVVNIDTLLLDSRSNPISVTNWADDLATAMQNLNFINVAAKDSVLGSIFGAGGETIAIHGVAVNGGTSTQVAAITDAKLEGAVGIDLFGESYSEGDVSQHVAVGGGQISATETGFEIFATGLEGSPVMQVVDLTEANISAPTRVEIYPDEQTPGDINQIVTE